MPSRASVVSLLLSGLAIAGCDRQAAAPEQANSAAAVPAPAAAAPKGGAFDRTHKGEPAPAVAFVDPDGKPVRFADFRGKPLLVNLWATWCAPCVAEMPTLDAAAGTLGDRVRVIAVSQDLDGRAKVDPFFAARKFRHLKPYTDPKIELSTAYLANLPVTVLYDGAGREVWRRAGAFEWNSPEAIAAISEAS